MPFYKMDNTAGIITMSAEFNWDEDDPTIQFTEEEIERGYDGVLYLKSKVPAVPQEILARDRMTPVLKEAQDRTDEFLREKSWDSLSNVLSQTGAYADEARIAQEQYDKLWASVHAVQAQVERGTMSSEAAIAAMYKPRWA